MLSSKEFIQILNEKRGDFGYGVKPPEPECFGKTTTYKMLPGKRVCKFKRKR